jgi:hypothetical protein
MYIGRRNVEGGGRQQDFHNSSFRGLIGSRGDIAEGWSYDVSTQFSRTSANTRTLNYFSLPKINDALDAVTDPDTGLPVCRSGNAGCVPYNVFTPGGITPEALAYIQAPGLQIGIIDQNINQGVITATSARSVPSCRGRTSRSRWRSVSKTATSTCRTRRTTCRRRRCCRVRVARRSHRRLDQRQRLLHGSERAARAGQAVGRAAVVRHCVSLLDYSSGTTTDTYKFGMDWAPIEDVRFRASFQRAVRAPNIVELFTAQASTCSTSTANPCGENSSSAREPGQRRRRSLWRSLARVRRDRRAGEPVRFRQPGQPGGPVSVQPGWATRALRRRPRTRTLTGIVFTPRFAPGLSSRSTTSTSSRRPDLDVRCGNTLDACYELQRRAGLLTHSPQARRPAVDRRRQRR